MCSERIPPHTDGHCTGLCLSEQTWHPGGVTVLHSPEHLAAVNDDPSHSSLTRVPRADWTHSPPHLFLSGRDSAVLSWVRRTRAVDGLCSRWEEPSCVQQSEAPARVLVHPEEVRVARQVFIQLERDTMWWGFLLLQAQASLFFSSAIDEAFV